MLFPQWLRPLHSHQHYTDGMCITLYITQCMLHLYSTLMYKCYTIYIPITITFPVHEGSNFSIFFKTCFLFFFNDQFPKGIR